MAGADFDDAFTMNFGNSKPAIVEENYTNPNFDLSQTIPAPGICVSGIWAWWFLGISLLGANRRH